MSTRSFASGPRRIPPADRPLPAQESHPRVSILGTVKLARIKTMSYAQILELQARLGYGEDWGVWSVPKEWIPRTFHRPSSHTVVADVRTKSRKHAWKQVLRYALLRTLVRGPQTYANHVTVLNEIKLLVRLTPLLLAQPTTRTKYWSFLTEDQIASTLGQSSNVQSIIAFMKLCVHLGYAADAPKPPPMDDGIDERDRSHDSVPTMIAKRQRKWQPLPDDFVGLCGQRVIWIIRHISSNLLDCLERTLDQRDSPPRRRKDQFRWDNRRNETIEKWPWLDTGGGLIATPPFHLRVSPVYWINRDTPAKWPPRNWGQALWFLYVLQTCHMWVVLLTLGPRASTILSLNEECLVPVTGGYRLKGTQYKTKSPQGTTKLWPVPPIVEFAVNQQIRLARIVKRISDPNSIDNRDPHLWVQVLKNTGRPIVTPGDGIKALAQVLDLESLLLGSSIHIHRFRETLARIVALTLTNAQSVLMDCFGHEDPNMTLTSYIMSDPLIVADVQRVQRELVLIMAKDALIDSDNLGGPGGTRVKQMKASYLRLHKKSVLDPKDIDELAEALTLGGRDWMVVMPGIICTLPLYACGPCAHGAPGRDPSNCQSGCAHQILLAYNMSEVDDTVAYIVDRLASAIAQDSINVATWVAQLRNWLYRWPEVFRKWANHPVVREHGDPRMVPPEEPA